MRGQRGLFSVRCFRVFLAACERPEKSINPMNLQADQLVDTQVLHSPRLQAANEIRRHPMDAHGDQLIRLRMSVSQLLQLPDKIRRHSMNPESDQSVEIH